MKIRRIISYIIDLYINIYLTTFIINALINLLDNKLKEYAIIPIAFLIFYIIQFMSIFLLKRTVGQRIFNLEFYCHNEYKITIKKIIFRSLLSTLLMAVTFWYGVIKNNIFIIDNITQMYVRKYIKK